MLTDVGQRPLVLACEDEERIVELLRTLTEPLGVDLIAAHNGAAALAHLQLRRPWLMTLDLVLPNIDGFGLLERIRQRPELDDMPILVISALSDVQSLKRAYAYGVVDFVVKPFNVDLLDAKLRVFLRMRKLQEDLRSRQAFLEEVVDHVSSGLIVVDAQRVIVKVNAAGAIQVSRAVGELMGRAISEVLPGAEPMFEVLGDATQRRAIISTPHGQRVLGFTNAQVEVNGGHGVVAVFRELSDVEAVKREQVERRRREDLAQSARSFAHEVRNPLAAIGAAAQVIARPDCADPQRVRLARAIESEAERVTGLVQEYVERRQTPSPARVVDIAAVLSEIVEVNLLASAARDRITLQCALALPRVRADAARLKQVVLNLVLNAVNATDQGGTIALGAREHRGGVALTVSDTGCGIPKQSLTRIFDEGYSTRGGGLGLPIARRIVESHGGTIGVESTEGHGTTFTVWLPSG